MAQTSAIRVKETTATTGAGTLTLAGAAAGFQTFVAGVGNGNTCLYTLLDADGIAWESGIGTVTDGTPNDTLARTTVIASSNANAAITLTSGTHVVFVSAIPGYADKDMNYQDLLLQRPVLKDYAKTVAAGSVAGTVLTLNLENGNVFTGTVNGNIDDVVVSNIPPAGTAWELELYLTMGVGAYTVTFPKGDGSSGQFFIFDNDTDPTIDNTYGYYVIRMRGVEAITDVVFCELVNRNLLP